MLSDIRHADSLANSYVPYSKQHLGRREAQSHEPVDKVKKLCINPYTEWRKYLQSKDKNAIHKTLCPCPDKMREHAFF
jgi:hypothetical protein